MVDVSVLTPSWNYGRFIEDALLSVLGQKEVLVQHVVQDGGSSDETLSILSSFDAHIDWLSEPDQGQSHALNKALSRATGRWIGWLNADEFYLPGSLSHLVRIGERSGADVVYGDCVFVDQAGRMVRLLPRYRFSSQVLTKYGTCISSCSLIIRRSLLGQDPWDVRIRRVMDWDLYMRLFFQGGRFLHVRYPVGAFRVHADQVTATPWQEWQEEDELIAARYGRSTQLMERWKSYKRGRWLHRSHKLVGGSYVRELRARALRGRDLRWFNSSIGHANSIEFLQRVYGRSLPQAGRRVSSDPTP